MCLHDSILCLHDSILYLHDTMLYLHDTILYLHGTALHLHDTMKLWGTNATDVLLCAAHPACHQGVCMCMIGEHAELHQEKSIHEGSGTWQL